MYLILGNENDFWFGVENGFVCNWTYIICFCIDLIYFPSPPLPPALSNHNRYLSKYSTYLLTYLPTQFLPPIPSIPPTHPNPTQPQSNTYLPEVTKKTLRYSISYRYTLLYSILSPPPRYPVHQ